MQRVTFPVTIGDVPDPPQLPEHLKGRPVDWAQVRAEFQNATMILEPFQLPSKESIGRDRIEREAQKRAPVSKKPFTITRLDHYMETGQLAYPGGRNEQASIARINSLIEAYGLRGGEGDGPPRNYLEIIKNAIEHEKLSLEFVIAWGHLKALVGRYMEVSCQQDAARATYERGRKAGSGASMLFQQVWYARWTLAHSAKLTRDKRDEIDQQIAELCLEIDKGKRGAPRGYSKDWFKRLIKSEAEGRGGREAKQIDREADNRFHVLPTLSRLGAPKLKALAERADVPDSALPPLDEKNFPA